MCISNGQRKVNRLVSNNSRLWRTWEPYPINLPPILFTPKETLVFYEVARDALKHDGSC